MSERPLREVTQWFLAGREDGIPGDCVRAAVASLLNLDPAEVPHFTCQDDTRVWPLALAAFANQHGWNVERREFKEEEGDRLPRFGLAIGQSPRGISHAVVTRDGEIAWDPHPSREGLRFVQQVIEFTEPGAYAWGQSITLNKATATVDIPINDGSLCVGTVQLGIDDVRVLRDMLNGVLGEVGGCDA